MFAGSFDPVHLGHLGVIESGARLFDRVWVVAAGNPAKPSGLLSLQQRRDLIAVSTTHLPNVDALSHSGLLVELAKALGVDALIRGAGKERSHEFEMAHANSSLVGIATVFVPPRADSWWISSRLVRERFDQGDLDALEEMVPPRVASALSTMSLTRPRT
jgi:pantetheine-phosphate adenylyltransferase